MRSKGLNMFQQLTSRTRELMEKLTRRPTYVAFSRIPNAAPYVHAIGDRKALEQLTEHWAVTVAKVERNSTIEWENIGQ